MHASGYIITDGVWQNGSKTPSPEGWVHLEMISDNYKNEIVIMANDTEIYKGPIKFKSKSNLDFKLQQRSERTDETRSGVTIDNFCASQTYDYSLSSVEWVQTDGSWSSDASSIPVNITKIRMKMSESLLKDSVNMNNVIIYDNGKRVSLSDVSYDESNNYVIATLGETLSEQSNIVFELTDDIVLTNTNNPVGVATRAFFVTEPSKNSPTDISYTVSSDGDLLSTRQLKTGDEISVDFTLNNQSGQYETMAAVVCVLQNGKLRAIGACEETVTTAKQVRISLPPLQHLDAEGDVSIKLMVCEKLSKPHAIVEFVEMN